MWLLRLLLDDETDEAYASGGSRWTRNIEVSIAGLFKLGKD